ncbi:MAG: helix-turn-helix transcriptional regulator [Lachnospiraceae bacterium]|nr:helix-turn-helix transcriptional regulator [Lachnospiraceae bacterium]
MEQFVDINFEILSVSYVITEMFLLGLHILLKEQARRITNIGTSDNINITDELLPVQSPDNPSSTLTADTTIPSTDEEMYNQFIAGIASLTPTELSIFRFYLDQKSTKEIMVMLNIKENTLKFHNKNIYGKLGVSSRKQLVSIAQKINY